MKNSNGLWKYSLFLLVCLKKHVNKLVNTVVKIQVDKYVNKHVNKFKCFSVPWDYISFVNVLN